MAPLGHHVWRVTHHTETVNPQVCGSHCLVSLKSITFSPSSLTILAQVCPTPQPHRTAGVSSQHVQAPFHFMSSQILLQLPPKSPSSCLHQLGNSSWSFEFSSRVWFCRKSFLTSHANSSFPCFLHYTLRHCYQIPYPMILQSSVSVHLLHYSVSNSKAGTIPLTQTGSPVPSTE